ncbi:MAG: MMPL family transporter [Deltaproteobacteria bacterium]|nr:MMPL family transporter [Deltaproteobacteria bacterium]
MAARLERLLSRTALACHGGVAVVLPVALAIALGSVWATRRLSMSADLSELLPDDFESVRDLRRIQQSFGGFGTIAVLARGIAPDRLQAFAAEAANRLERLEGVRFVEWRRPRDFFERHALYFLDLSALEALEQRIADRIGWEKRRRNPLFVDLAGTPPPPIDLAGAALDRLPQLSQAGRTSLHFLDEQRREIALFVKPGNIGSDLRSAARLVESVRGVIDAMDLRRYGSGLSIEYGGPFVKRIDQQDLITRDLGRITFVAALAILVCLYLHFRSIAAVFFLFFPLAVGLMATYGFAALTMGSLNVLTAFIGAVLLGLGIDHGIHLLGRMQTELARADLNVALARTFGTTGRAVWLAATTTAIAFGALALSRFRAFHEFGILAMAGTTFILLSYSTVLPALLALVSPRRITPPASVGSTWLMDRIGRHRRGVLLAAALASVTLAFAATCSRFDYDTRSLAESDLASFRLDPVFDRLRGYQMTPLVYLARDAEDERRAAEAFRRRQRLRRAESTIDLVMARSDFVPTEQAEKRAVLARISTLLAPLDVRDLHDGEAGRVEWLTAAVRAEPFTESDLPIEVTRQFSSRNANERFVLLFAAVDLADGRKVVNVAKEVRGLDLANGDRISAAGEPLIMADVFSLVADEIPLLSTFTVVLVSATLWVLVGGFRAAIVALVPALLTIVTALGTLTLVGWRINTVNIIVIPLLFGIGVDGGVHLVTTFVRSGGSTVALSDASRAIVAALATSAIGFGSLALANHSGLSSIGRIALVGLICNATACLLALPAYLMGGRRWFRRGCGASTEGTLD